MEMEMNLQATNIQALQAAIKLVADLVNDSIKAAGDSNSFEKMEEFTNILPDVIALIPVIGQIPAEVSDLQPAEYAALISSIGADLVLPEGKASAIVSASIKLLSDIALVIVPDIQAIVAAAQS